MPVDQTLRALLTDRKAGWFDRGTAAEVLGFAEPQTSTTILLDLFFRGTDAVGIWEVALTMERARCDRVVPSLIRALRDDNPDRRHAAARALGWIWPVGRRAVDALARALVDPEQPEQVREQAAESLGYSFSRRAMKPLIAALRDPSPRIRFWAVLALGQVAAAHPEPAIGKALEGMLEDSECPSGGWWSIGLEALAMLAASNSNYEPRLAERIQAIDANPNAPRQERRWADGYREMLIGIGSTSPDRIGLHAASART
jgi:HEAT repeat protein